MSPQKEQMSAVTAQPFFSPVSRPVISGGVLGRFAPNVEEEEVSRMMAGIGLSVGLGESLGFAAKLW